MGSLPPSEDVENYNESDSAIYISKVVTHLRLRSNITNESILNDLINRLCNTYCDYADFLPTVIRVLLNCNFCEIANEIFIYLIQCNQYQCESMDNLLSMLINFSDFSLDISKAILSSNIFGSFVDYCIKNHELNIKSENKFICDILTVIHNIVRYPENIPNYKIDLFKETLVKFIKINNSDKLGILSTLTLSYVIDENETNLLEEGSNAVQFLINKIKNVNKVDGRSEGFSIKEMLNGLLCISANDNMKKKICHENGLALLFTLIKENRDAEVLELVLRILWNLCFNEEIKELLINDYKIEDVINGFLNHESCKIKENCDGILWLIKNKSSSKELLKTAKSRQFEDECLEFKFDVFISYSREYKETIHKMKKEIIKSKLRVWFDDEQMFGSTIEAMAKGIENSRVFIIAISKAYKESPNCRCEAEYAFKLHKPMVPVILQLKYKPMSWLGFIIGTKMYYEFSERRDPKETMSNIIVSIKHLLNDNPDKEEEDKYTLIEPEKSSFLESGLTNIIENERNKIVEPSSSESDAARKNVNEKIKAMSKSDVRNWLIESELDRYKNHLCDVDGSLILVLASIKSKSPEYFNLTLKKEFGMKFVDVLKFHKAVDSLFI